MDAINSLAARSADPDRTDPVEPAAAHAGDVDVAEQLVSMTVTADLHHVTTAALRSAVSLYCDSLELFRP